MKMQLIMKEWLLSTEIYKGHRGASTIRGWEQVIKMLLSIITITCIIE